MNGMFGIEALVCGAFLAPFQGADGLIVIGSQGIGLRASALGWILESRWDSRSSGMTGACFGAWLHAVVCGGFGIEK
jgi:hypothetical protein